jgi:hypothetical protein
MDPVAISEVSSDPVQPRQSEAAGTGTQASVWNQEPHCTSLAIDQIGVKVPEALPAWAQEIGGPNRDAHRVPDVHGSNWKLRLLIMTGMFLMMLGLGWCGGFYSRWLLDLRRDDVTSTTSINAVVEQIISAESKGDPDAKNKRSSATGLGQFLDETWLDLIRTYRPDLARGRSRDEALELRRDAKVAREITARFTEQNARMLRKRSLPVTPGTLYLAHFAGGAGAVAILSALDNVDAASIMASADATGRTKREKIVKANPFLERFTVADLKSWADRKMRIPRS